MTETPQDPADMAMRATVTEAAIALFTRTMHGHMGEIAYLNGGGEKFEKFTQHPKYYVFRDECELMKRRAKDIAKELKGVKHLVVVGQGPAKSFKNKEMLLLDHLPELEAVTFIDVSASFNTQARKAVKDWEQTSGRKLATRTLTMDFHNAANHVKRDKTTAVISTGSLISNVHNAPERGFPDQIMIEMLRAFRALASDDGKIVLGYDSNNDAQSLGEAYDKNLEDFIVNITTIIEDHCDGLSDFHGGTEYFRYEEEWMEKSQQTAHKLVAAKAQSFTITHQGKTMHIDLEPGDEFVCMSSLKPSPKKMARLGEHAGIDTTNIYELNKKVPGMVEHVYAPRTAANTPVTPPAPMAA